MIGRQVESSTAQVCTIVAEADVLITTIVAAYDGTFGQKMIFSTRIDVTVGTADGR